MIITTTDSIEGKKIVEYKGVISREAVLGINIIRDIFAKVRDIVGGRSGSYEKELINAREQILEELKRDAEKLGANCIVGLSFSYEMYQSMLLVSVWGTAVVVE
ncbi:heavy metal-binding domain-containing protein [Persephonella sp.]